ncbi:Flp pilus assembly protein CpaB [Nevskia ramosa]|uniref:Flp pilus assembly protein CpaB n=1 Tax=Nevskia ramosa TaxID=64002 RepID=UPI0003B7293A|nr:Flp pilus assembly protein CpaB [Nevskia ramosa]
MNNSNAIRIVAIVLGLLAIILAIVGWRMSRSFAESASKAQEQQPVSAAPAVPQIMVVIATRPLAANMPIDRDAIVLAPVTIAPTEYFANVDDAIGRTPLIDIDAGAPVVPRFFKDANMIARGVPDGFRALSLKVDDVVGVGGFVRPGDTVDVLVYIKSVTSTPTGEKSGPDKTEDIPTQARVLIRDIRVLSYEDHLVEPPKGLPEEKDKQSQNQGRRERTAVLAIPEAQVTKVLLGSSYGELRLALHGTPATTAATTDASAPAISAVSSQPLSPEAKAKADAEAELAAAQIITATELTQLIAKGKKKAVRSEGPPRIEIYRGSDLKTVSP